MTAAYAREDINYRGFIISVETVKMISAGWNVNIGTLDKGLLKKLLLRGNIVSDVDRDTAIKKAKNVIDDLMDNT